MHGALIGEALAIGAMLAALAYGTVFLGRPPTALRTIVKTLAVGLLAAASWALGLPLGLTAGLALSSLGDAFLAGDPKRWLPFGLASFLTAHLVYIGLFVTRALGRHHGFYAPADTFGLTGVRLLGMIAAVLAAGSVLRWLWSGLGALRWAVVAYVAAIVAMVCASFALPDNLWRAMVGAALFFASDAILAAQLFRQRFVGRIGELSVWWLYWFGQGFFFYAIVNDTLARFAP
ncbi:MAG TPA: lysoplasmalogenase family protein [Caulobacteraceae bacterium]|nr:lysoplasmalogenase family protein [Caulobacteraceae bacterium]